jgi:hypothetical protein
LPPNNVSGIKKDDQLLEVQKMPYRFQVQCRRIWGNPGKKKGRRLLRHQSKATTERYLQVVDHNCET